MNLQSGGTTCQIGDSQLMVLSGADSWQTEPVLMSLIKTVLPKLP